MDTYEKKYKNALTIAQSRFKIEKDESVLTCLGMMFPELRESEDERIRKAIIELLKEVEEDETYTGRQHIPEMLAYLEKQKEQKPNIELIQRSWYMEGYHDREFGMEPKWIIKTGEGGPKHELNPRYGQHLAENPKEQKPAEKQDYSGLNNLERAILRGFLCAGMENVPVGIIKDTASECMAFLALIEPKPAEWSEEDADILNCCIYSIEEAKENRYAYKETDGDTSYDREIDWLKSLRPSWKPSEEQLNCLCVAVDAAIRKHNESVSGYKPARVLKSLYEDLQKL